MGKKKRLKAHVQRHMERRLRGNKKPRQKIVNDSKKDNSKKQVEEKVVEDNLPSQTL